MAGEVTELRTRNSRTFARKDGRGFAARISASAVNYKAPDGDWRKIDTSLHADGSGLVNGANRFDLSLPGDLGSGAVRVAEGGDSVSMRLEDAAGAVKADGNEASYADALPGVDVHYASNPDSVKEVLSLERADAPSTFRFHVTASDGLDAKLEDDGSVEFSNGDGRRQFVLPAPLMQDSAKPSPVVSGRVHYTLARDGSGWALSVVVNQDWLNDPDRVFPVAVDPTVELPSGVTDCDIWATQTAADCSDPSIWIGNSQAGTEFRGLLRFGIASALPKDTTITDARLRINQTGAENATPVSIAAYRMTRSWTTGATWQTADGTNQWTTPGGEFTGSALDTVTLDNQAARRTWNLTDQAQRWIDGTDPDLGVVLKPTATTKNLLYFNATESTTTEKPELVVLYQPRLSNRSTYTLDSQTLNDRTDLSVNVANGNLRVDSRDLNIAGTGMPLAMSRIYNSGWAGTYLGNFGTGQTGSPGPEVWYEPLNNNQNIAVYLGDGQAHLFRHNADDSYTSPDEIDADFKKTAPYAYELMMHDTGAKYVWVADATNGQLVSRIEDRNGNKISFGYDANHALSSMTDTQGRVTTVVSNVDRLVTSMTDPAGRTFGYGYTNNSLTTYTDPAGKITRYEYNGVGGRMSKITTPGGRVTEITYTTAGKVATVKRVTNVSTGTGLTTTYAYSSGSPCVPGQIKAVVTDPRSNATTYCADERTDRVEKAVDAKGHETSTSYTAHGNVSSVQESGASSATTSTYDSAGTIPTNNLKSATAPAGEKTTYDYPDAATESSRLRYLPKQYTNAQGHGSKMIYDAGNSGGPGNVTEIADSSSAASNKATLTYNPDGTVASATDGKANRTTYQYDSKGNRTGVTPQTAPPLTAGGPAVKLIGATAIEYEKNASGVITLSRVAKVTDGQLRSKVYGYDKLDRVTRVTNSDGSYTSYGYDDDGNQTSQTDVTGSTSTVKSITYDLLGRQTGQTLPGGKTTTYTYDGSNNLATLTDAGGTVTYAYDAANLLASIAEPLKSGQTVAPTTTFGYDARNNRTSTLFPNGVAMTAAYDDSNKLTSLSYKKGTTVLKSWNYDFNLPLTDPVSPGLKTEQIQNVVDQSGAATTYTYDSMDRLRRAVETLSGTTRRDYGYDYDLASNIKQRRVSGSSVPASLRGITSYAYNEDNQLCWSAPSDLTGQTCGSVPTGATTYAYDSAGNQTTSSAGQTLGYNARGQMNTFTLPGVAQRGLSYLGDGHDQLVAKDATTYQNDKLGLGVLAGSTGTYYFTRDPSGTPIGERLPDGTTDYYMVDHIGSVTGLTGPTGVVHNSYTYDPYGRQEATTGTVSNYLRYAGGLDISDTGRLYHFGARYYDPDQGRWTQLDPLDQNVNLNEANRYSYGAGDPIGRVDSSGCFSIRKIFKAAACVGRCGLRGHLQDCAEECVACAVFKTPPLCTKCAICVGPKIYRCVRACSRRF